jgi:hypothetical protein
MVVLLHPGINKINLAGGVVGLGPAFEPKETVERLFKVISEKTIEGTGKFSSTRDTSCRGRLVVRRGQTLG